MKNIRWINSLVLFSIGYLLIFPVFYEYSYMPGVGTIPAFGMIHRRESMREIPSPYPKSFVRAIDSLCDWFTHY